MVVLVIIKKNKGGARAPDRHPLHSLYPVGSLPRWFNTSGVHCLGGSILRVFIVSGFIGSILRVFIVSGVQYFGCSLSRGFNTSGVHCLGGSLPQIRYDDEGMS